jgi:hypothetical protein
MSFNKIAAIIATAAVSTTFAGVAQADESASGDFTGEVKTVCTVTSPNGPIPMTADSQTAATKLTGSASYPITCNGTKPKAVVAVDNLSPNYAIAPNTVADANFTTGSTGAFAAVNSGKSGTATGAPTATDSVKVKVDVAAATLGNLLPAFKYKVPAKVTVTPN